MAKTTSATSNGDLLNPGIWNNGVPDDGDTVILGPYSVVLPNFAAQARTPLTGSFASITATSGKMTVALSAQGGDTELHAVSMTAGTGSLIQVTADAAVSFSVFGNLYGGSAADACGMLVSGNTGTVNHVGLRRGGTSDRACGVRQNGNCALNLTGASTGYTGNRSYGVWLTGTGATAHVGDSTGGGNASAGVRQSGAGVFAFTGGGTGGTEWSSPGLEMLAGTWTLTGNLIDMTYCRGFHGLSPTWAGGEAGTSYEQRSTGTKLYNPTPLLPAAVDVQAGVTFGIGGGSTGTFAPPGVGDVKADTKYGGGGTEFTGILALPRRQTQ